MPVDQATARAHERRLRPLLIQLFGTAFLFSAIALTGLKVPSAV